MKIIIGFLVLLTVIPFNYFFENNFNALPYQIIIAIVLASYVYRIKYKNLYLIVVTIFCLIVISKFSLSNLMFSPMSASFILFWTVLSTQGSKISPYTHQTILTYLTYTSLIFVLYFNIDFLINHNFLEERSRGFGSGTIFSIMSLLNLIFIYKEYIHGKINISTFFLLFVGFLSTIILTQSRGALMTFVFAFVYIEFFEQTKINKRRVLLVLGCVFYLILNSTFLERFNINNYNNDLDNMTSGRSITQIYIFESILNSDNFITLFLGNGLNSVKINLVPLGLEFPHLDLLYVLYEGGVVLLVVYVTTLYWIGQKFQNKVYFWIFVISSLHTNMILSPGVLFLSLILDNKSQRTKLGKTK